MATAPDMKAYARPALSWILILGAVVAIGPMAIDMYLPALPALQRSLATGPAGVQWTLAVFFLGLSLGQLVYGPLSDRYGRKTPLVLGLSLYAAASVGCALASSIDTLIALRLLQAAGACAGMVITRAILRDLYEPQDMARVISLLVLVMGVAPMLAPLAGTLVLEVAGWRAIFAVLAAFGALCVALIVTRIDESHPPERRLAQVSVLSALRAYGHLLGHRKFVGYALSGAIAQAGMFAYITVSAFVFIEAYGLSPTAYAWLFGINAAGLIAAAQANAWLLRRLPAQRVLRGALRVYLAAAVVMTLSALTGVGEAAGVAVPLWICITSVGFTFPNSIAAAMAPFGDRAGSASALLGMMQFAAAGSASYLVGLAYDGTALAMAVMFVACGVGSLLLLRFAAQAAHGTA